MKCTNSHLPLVFLLFFNCSIVGEDAQSIIDKSISAHGGNLYENSTVEFDFRNRHYQFERNEGLYTYHRIFSDSLGTYHDVLNNDGFTRFLNEQQIKVTSEWQNRYSNSINSVAYFAYLPFGLNDPAVNKKLIGEEEINENYYYQIEVTFNQHGGGEDFEDVFVYWINKENFFMEYFGYYYITDGGGIRFREAFNSRTIKGLTFSDYVNYAGEKGNTNVAGLGELFKSGKLNKLSEIKIENLNIILYN